MTNIQLAQGGGGTLYPPDQFSTFTPEDIAARSQFAKVEFVSEQVKTLCVRQFQALQCLTMEMVAVYGQYDLVSQSLHAHHLLPHDVSASFA